ADRNRDARGSDPNQRATLNSGLLSVTPTRQAGACQRGRPFFIAFLTMNVRRGSIHTGFLPVTRVASLARSRVSPCLEQPCDPGATCGGSPAAEARVGGQSRTPQAPARSFARWTVSGSEGDDGSDRRLHERVRERACELVDGFPAGAVRGQDSAYFCGDESIDCRLDDRFEDAAREV